MNRLLDTLTTCLNDGMQTLMSVTKILLFSKFVTRIPRATPGDELVVLLNGPSLNDTIARSLPFIMERQRLVVNFAATTPLFEQVKPQRYIVADPFFWIDDAVCNQLLDALIAKTYWPLSLYIPTAARRNKLWNSRLEGNPHISLYHYNATPLEGYRWFIHWAYNRQLGVPRPHNVLTPSLMVGLWTQFPTIYIAGADHSWIEGIRVNDRNEAIVCLRHYYDADKQEGQRVLRPDYTPAPLHEILYHQYVAFKSYFDIDRYARSRGQHIYNITPGSYIDAFDRKKLAQDVG